MTYSNLTNQYRPQSRSRYKRRLVIRVQVFILCLILFVIGFLCGRACAASTEPEPAQADALEVEPPPFVIQINTEPETNALEVLEAEQPTQEAVEQERETFNLYEHIAMEMTSEEMRLLELILALEAQDEPFDGQKAVVEVIFNRVLSPDFPDTVYDVLSQKGQFATWKWRNKPYNTPNQTQKDVIAEVIEHGNQNTILPEGYVFFSVGKVNGTDFIKIGNHQFSRARKKS